MSPGENSDAKRALPRTHTYLSCRVTTGFPKVLWECAASQPDSEWSGKSPRQRPTTRNAHQQRLGKCSVWENPAVIHKSDPSRAVSRLQSNSLGRHESYRLSQTVCRSVQPFLHAQLTIVPNTEIHRHTDHAMCNICIAVAASVHYATFTKLES